MTPERWREVTEIFHAALSRDATARADFLAARCGTDSALRAEVDVLLAAHDDAGSFGATPSSVQSVIQLDPGTALGPYRIQALIGAGGMGVVYRAEDTRLGRDVALKVLPPEAADAERRRRFAREAQIVASLNHPNIVTLHSVEQSADHYFLTMELVDGQTLRELIPRGGVPLDRLLDIAVPLADAVGAAHAQGIVHRDLKPGNVMVTPDGRVKVLDFGLAKLTASDPITGYVSKGVVHDITEDKRVLGTAAYMSPEQAEGHDVDHRSDIFSLGVMFYELATGVRPFVGESTALLLSSLLRDTPPAVTDVRPELPQALGRLIRRCLAKDPNRRYQSAHDLRNELDEIREDVESGDYEASLPANGGTSSRFPRRWALAGGSLLLACVAAVGPFVRAKPEGSRSPRSPRLAVLLPPAVRLNEAGALPWLAISPDGQSVAFYGASDDPNKSGLYLRLVNELEPRLIMGGRSPRFSPFFSPDSQWLGYFANGAIWKLQVKGGEPVRICDADGGGAASWADDGTIVFNRLGNDGIWRVSDRGGQPVILTRFAPDARLVVSHVLPGSQAALFTLTTGLGDARKTVALVSLKTGAVRKLFAGSSPRYVGAGFLVYRWTDALHAAPFDLARLDVTGPSRPVLHDVNYYSLSGPSAFDVSSEGSLIYTPGAPRAENSELVWLDRQGRTEPVAIERQPYDRPELDPEGRRVAVHIKSNPDFGDLSVYDMSTRSWSQLTQGFETLGLIAWSSDGQWIVSSSNRSGSPKLFRIRAIGGTPEVLTEGIDWDYVQGIDSRNVALLARQFQPGGQVRLMTLSLDNPRQPELLAHLDPVTGPAKLSPDGQWIAYQSDVTRTPQVFVRPYPGLQDSGRHFVAAEGLGPRWRPDSRRLFFRRAQEIWEVPVRLGQKSIDLDAPQLVIRHDSLISPGYGRVEPSVDGQRFLVVRTPAREQKERLLLYVPNWIDEVREALGR